MNYPSDTPPACARGITLEGASLCSRPERRFAPARQPLHKGDHPKGWRQEGQAERLLLRLGLLDHRFAGSCPTGKVNKRSPVLDAGQKPAYNEYRLRRNRRLHNRVCCLSDMATSAKVVFFFKGPERPYLIKGA